VHLKGLSNLQKLYLRSTKITDAGLVHLKGLTKLQTLVLSETKVTEAGVAELQKALPNCKISK
jgi:Leucine-rich repeat (LRR) protein